MNKIKQELILPTEYSEDLAEETGIHIGDGSMNCYKSKGKTYWGYVHSTHAISDKEHSDYVRKLMKRLYNLDPYERVCNNCRMLTYTRKSLILFKEKMGLPMGKKSDIGIPGWILKEDQFKRKCLRGIFDTDGTIRFRKCKTLSDYPEVKITNKSKILMEQITDILNEINISYNIFREKGGKPRKPFDIWYVTICGRKQVPKFFDVIGSSNPKHLNKYNSWKIKDGGGVI